MADVLFPLLYGPTGRYVSVDASGRLVTTGDSGSDLYILGYGSTGRPICVDASGRFVLSPLITSVGTTETAANIGTGSGLIYSSKVGSEIQLRTLLSGSGISVSTSGSVIIISSTSYDDIALLQTSFTNASGNWEAAIAAAEGEGLDFANASGNLVSATSAAAATANGVRTDFDNASGNFAKKQDWSRITDLVNDSYTLNVAGGNLYDIDLDEDCTITFSNQNDGEKYMLLFTQASGDNTVAWEARVKWVGGSAPTITAASGSMDVVSLIYNSRLNIFLADVAADIGS